MAAHPAKTFTFEDAAEIVQEASRRPSADAQPSTARFRDARLDTDRAIRAAMAQVQRAFHGPAKPIAEQVRGQIDLAKTSLAHAAEMRRYNMRCFPGIYRRDRAVCLRASALMLATCASRRRHIAQLRVKEMLVASVAALSGRAA